MDAATHACRQCPLHAAKQEIEPHMPLVVHFDPAYAVRWRGPVCSGPGRWLQASLHVSNGPAPCVCFLHPLSVSCTLFSTVPHHVFVSCTRCSTVLHHVFVSCTRCLSPAPCDERSCTMCLFPAPCVCLLQALESAPCVLPPTPCVLTAMHPVSVSCRALESSLAPIVTSNCTNSRAVLPRSTCPPCPALCFPYHI